MTLKAFLGFVLVSFSAHATIPQFAEVEAGVFRGGRPDARDLKALSQKGFKTILSLERPDTVAQERKKVEALGMKFLSIPLDVYKTPTDVEIDTILGHLKDQALHPIFLHCKHGEDRTGLVMGLYRVEVTGFSPAEAYAEMLKFDFHAKYEALDNYFRRRTGF